MNPAEANKKSHLVRALGLWSALAVIIGSMVGQSVFLVASDMASDYSHRVWEKEHRHVTGGQVAVL
jgi:hypothetical protein